jgi:hypothetical protein
MEKIAGNFFSHSPRCLFEQIVHKQSAVNISQLVITGPIPHIERFMGALLFVDISGFTMLAQKMDVNQLSLLINQFFTKLIDIIHSHGGDIVKFPGDAMFIVWKVIPEEADFLQPSQLAASKAARCGMEIIEKCGHYRSNLYLNNPMLAATTFVLSICKLIPTIAAALIIGHLPTTFLLLNIQANDSSKPPERTGNDAFLS